MDFFFFAKEGLHHFMVNNFHVNPVSWSKTYRDRSSLPLRIHVLKEQLNLENENNNSLVLY